MVDRQYGVGRNSLHQRKINVTIHLEVVLDRKRKRRNVTRSVDLDEGGAVGPYNTKTVGQYRWRFICRLSRPCGLCRLVDAKGIMAGLNYICGRKDSVSTSCVRGGVRTLKFIAARAGHRKTRDHIADDCDIVRCYRTVSERADGQISLEPARGDWRRYRDARPCVAA